MHLTELTLNNFRKFKDVRFEFNPNLTVISGNNGSGKTTLLDACAIMLSNIVSYVENGKTNKDTLKIDNTDIKNDQNNAKIAIVLKSQHFNSNDNLLNLSISKNRTSNNSLKNINQVAKIIQEQYEQLQQNNTNSQMPMFAYYSSKRSCVDFPIKHLNEYKFDAIESYNHAFNKENDFYLFFEWFKDRQNLENEQFLSTSYFNYRDNQLNLVRETIYKFLPHISDIFFTNKTKTMTLKENGNNISINQLSYGIKMLLVLIGDIARRLVMINSNKLNPLDGNGVVLIDEIELYLDYQYRSQIISKLTELFPNIQFIITTNSSDLLIKQGKKIIL